MLTEKLKERFPDAILDARIEHGDETVTVNRDRGNDFFRALRDEPGFEFNLLVDVTAVDWPDRKPRFEVVYHLNSLTLGHRLRVKIPVDAAGAWVHSLTGLWGSADWLERECFDMFGIAFKGHPDLRRILMYDSFEGYPLRKDYLYNKRQPVVEEIDPVVHPLHPSK
ncbi:MAG TPA: NADH-quinone oxidoreductase subunit C [Patescibacteria group bacterium]|nr:NADH-quinone oxidoreductase subunit C [Patescibacteria group bacterium]